MVMFKYNLNKEWDRISKSIDKFITPRHTTKYENEQVEHIRPIIDVLDADKIVRSTPLLDKVIRVLSQDVILNNYTLDMPNIVDEHSTDSELKLFNNFWNDKNKFQLYLAATEYYKFGYAALEVRYDSDDIPVLLEQIPATSIRIRIKRFSGRKFCYVEQEINDETKLLRISHEDESRGTDYSFLDSNGIDDGSVGTAIWIGGGTVNTWYTIPYWCASKTNILTSIYIDELNYDKISSGNVPSGVLMFEGSYRKHKQGNLGFEEQLREQLHAAGCGTAMVYLEGVTPDSHINTQYIKLEDENYEYLQELKKECVSTILECYGVPKVRLMIDDITESMNSNKSDTLYEIYNKSIESEQIVFKQIINDFSMDELGVTYETVMDIPEFNDKTNVKVTTIINLFEQGLLTLGQSVEYLSRVLPDVNFDDIKDTEEEKLSRYYKGALLGGSDALTMPQQEGQQQTKQLMDKLQGAMGDGLFQ